LNTNTIARNTELLFASWPPIVKMITTKNLSPDFAKPGRYTFISRFHNYSKAQPLAPTHLLPITEPNSFFNIQKLDFP
jgi:hypothetical protein